MLKITALQDIRVAINQVIPQRGDPFTSTPPFRQQFAVITMKAGEVREDASMVYGLVPPGATIRSDYDAGQLESIPHPRAGEVVDFDKRIRLELIL